MQEIDSLTATTILAEEIFQEIFDIEDEFEQAAALLNLTDRAKALAVKSKFETMYKAYKKKREKQAAVAKIPQSSENSSPMTDLDGNYPQMFCGSWIVNNNGIRTTDMLGREIVACYHPIIPIKRLVNLETDKEKMVLAFKSGNRWKEKTVEKEVIASSARIVQLAPYGINVTTESSKYIVKYLSDIENYNLGLIPTQMSTSKLGWIKKDFIPYSKDIIFDDESKFKDAFEAIHEQGDFDTWMELVKDIRQKDRFEPKIELVASFASVLVEPLNALPFILNIGGETGRGKTVSMMIATSVWANPSENTYMADAKGTVTSIELRMNFLNNLPLMIDDMSQVKEKYQGDFTTLIYNWCSGKGKDRSNTSLGMNKPTSWKNIILTNYEYLLVTETMQGGAVNRIIDIEAEEGMMVDNGNKIVEIICNNYGFAGRMFVDAVKEIGFEKIREMQKDYLNQIKAKAKEQNVEKEEKQALPMSILLTADKIATDYIFHDDVYLDFETCVNLLKNKGEVSENDRAYAFIMSEVNIHMNNFQPDDNGKYRGEIWGCFEHEYVIIQNNIFTGMAKRGNFSAKSFLSWAEKKGLIQTSKSRPMKQRRIDGKQPWCVCLKRAQTIEEFEESEDDAVKSDDKVEDTQLDGNNPDGFMEIPPELRDQMPWNVQ